MSGSDLVVDAAVSVVCVTGVVVFLYCVCGLVLLAIDLVRGDPVERQKRRAMRAFFEAYSAGVAKARTDRERESDPYLP